MAAEAFISFYEQYQTRETNNFYFKDFFKSYFPTKPTRAPIDYSQHIFQIVKQARDSFITNLALNDYFKHDDGYDMSVIEQIYNLLKETKENSNQNQIARIIFLLHVSNSNLEQFYYGVLFYLIDSIKLNKETEEGYEEEFSFNLDLNQLYEDLINNNRIKQVIQKVVRNICGKEMQCDLSSIKFKYFNSRIIGLNSFIGVNQIYVSNFEQNHFYQTFDSVKFTECDKISILKLNFTRLIISSLAHIALRSTLNDFNLSIPNVMRENQDSSQFNILKVGLIAERELFNANIDWVKSIVNKGFNLDYCLDFLDQLLNNKDVDFVTEKADVALNNSSPVIITADISVEENMIDIE